jgi:hypothetical protein
MAGTKKSPPLREAANDTHPESDLMDDRGNESLVVKKVEPEK